MIVLNNFADMKDSWIHSSDEIKRGCQDIIDQSHKSVEFWNIETSIGKGYGFGVQFENTYLVGIVPSSFATLLPSQDEDFTRDDDGTLFILYPTRIQSNLSISLATN